MYFQTFPYVAVSVVCDVAMWCRVLQRATACCGVDFGNVLSDISFCIYIIFSIFPRCRLRRTISTARISFCIYFRIHVCISFRRFVWNHIPDRWYIHTFAYNLLFGILPRCCLRRVIGTVQGHLVKSKNILNSQPTPEFRNAICCYILDLVNICGVMSVVHVESCVWCRWSHVCGAGGCIAYRSTEWLRTGMIAYIAYRSSEWMRCNTLQHTATHCNTLQHSFGNARLCCGFDRVRSTGLRYAV